MDLSGRPSSCSQSRRPSSPPWPARDHGRHLLRAKERLRLAAPASRLPSMEDRLPLLPLLASGRYLGEDALSPARAHAGSFAEKPSAERSHSGLPVGQDNGRGRRRARLRFGAKKVKGTKRHLLVDTQGLVLQAKVHRANVTDREGIKLLLEPAASTSFPRLC